MRMLTLIAAAAIACGSCDRLQGSAIPPQSYDGAYLVIEIDKAAAATEHLEQISDQAADILRTAGVRYVGRGVSDNVLRLRLERAAQLAHAADALAPIAGHLLLTTLPEGVIELRLNEAYLDTIVVNAAENSIGVIQRRLGTSAQVESHGAGRLIVRTPNDVVPEMVLRAVGARGQLTFHLVRELPPQPDSRIPVGAVLAEPYFDGQTLEVVQRRPELVGHVASASPSTDSITGQFVVSFQFDAEGARAFCRITREHTGQRFAVLLDQRVVTAPRINEPICGGSGQISGDFTAETATELATFLRAGALPLPFAIIEQGSGAPPRSTEPASSSSEASPARSD